MPAVRLSYVNRSIYAKASVREALIVLPILSRDGDLVGMYEREDDTAHISFQWVVGDNKAQEKNIRELIRSDHTYAITVASRLVAFALTYVVANALLP